MKLREGKPLSVLQDELGYALEREGGSCIQHWRRGNTPSKLSDLETLARKMVTRGQVERAWLLEFLLHGDHPNPADLCDELFPGDISEPDVPQDSRLPSKNYRFLVGRQRLVDEIISALQDCSGRWIVSIDGQGGIGKTALALDVTEQCQKKQLFTNVVWISAAPKEFAYGSGQEKWLTFENVLDAIGLQLGDNDLSKLKRAEKEQRVQALLRRQRTLVVLDNLETAGEPQNEIVRQLRPLLAPSKALLTSRHRFVGDLYTINLAGLEKDGAVSFIRQDAVEKGIRHVQAGSDEELKRIAEITGGSPLAMKLVVSQLKRLPLDVVLDNLRQATPLEDVGHEGEYVGFYKYVFFRSWPLLEKNEKRLLVAMARFVPANGCHFEALKHTSHVAQSVLVSSLDHLWELSFLEVGEVASLSQMRYYLHPLTQYFVLSDIVKVI